MTRDEIVALFNRRDQAWQRRDPAALAADHAENAVSESPMLGKLEGRARIQETYENWVTAFSDLSVIPTDLLVDGQRAVHFVNVSGTQTGPFGKVLPTGRRIQFTAVWLFEFDGDGRIIYDRRLYDVTTVLVQLGVLKTKAGN